MTRNVGDKPWVFIAKHLKPRNIGPDVTLTRDGRVRSRVMWRAIGASSHIADIWHRRFHRSHVSPAKTRSVAAITALASPSPSKEYARNSLVSIFRKALLLTISDRKILFTSSPTRVFLRYKLFNYLSRSRFLEK